MCSKYTQAHSFSYKSIQTTKKAIKYLLRMKYCAGCRTGYFGTSYHHLPTTEGSTSRCWLQVIRPVETGHF